MAKQLIADICIIGAGIAGLMLTKKLSDLGFHVVLVEKEERLATGPSTRNEGWLHRGTYHATSINDRQVAIQVANRCIYGHNQIRAYAPEAVEDIDLPAYAVIRDSARVNEVLSRWDEADITYKAIALSQLSEIAPTLKTQSLAAAYRVGDVSINSRMLYQKLVVDIQKSGTTIFTGTTISFKNYREALLQFNDHEAIQLEALIYVYATGYSTRTIFQQQFNRDVPMRYWKSHLVIVPRLSESAIFSIDRHEAAMMNHGDHSIVGLNEDAILCDEPSTEVIPENVDALLSAIQRLFHTKKHLPHCAIACIKVDAASSNQFARSLNVSVTEPIRNHICILPGKMTETPFLVDWVTRQIFDRFNRNSTIAYRPCDTVAFSPDIHNLN